MTQIVTLYSYATNPGDLSWSALEALGAVMIYDKTSASDVVSRIGDARIVILNKTVIDEAVLAT